MERQIKSHGVYFKSLRLENVRCFGSEALLDLSNGNDWQRWNVILGNNATGKTTLLQCASAFQIKKETPFSMISGLPVNYSNDFFGSNIDSEYIISGLLYSTALHTSLQFKANFFFAKFRNGQKKVFSQRFRYLNPVNESERLPSAIQSTLSIDAYPKNLILGYGATRFMSFSKLSDQKSEASETLFNENAKLINAEEWLLGMDYAASRDSNLKTFAEQRRQLIIEVLKEILPSITEIRFTAPTKENLVPRVEFKTDFGWAGIHQLSLGYKTMVAWIVDVAARMFERYPESDNPLAEPVVILVDEIDLHLHPKWQRKIFDFLTEKFPRAQFIVTAHSPLVVQSAPKDANIILLRQETDDEGNAYVKIDNDVESVRNWRLDQIMTSDLFGLESTRSPEIERLLDERKSLLQKDNLTPEEKARLKELNEISDSLPTAEDPTDRKAMEVIREAAEVLRKKTEFHD